MWPTAKASFRNGFLQRQVEDLRRLGVTCDVLVVPEQSHGVRGYATTALMVRRAVAEGGYRLVHAHYGLTAVACLFQRSRLVATFHGSDVYGAVGAGGRRTLKGRVERALSRIVAWRADAVVVVSARMARALRWANPTVVPVGIDAGLFRPCAQLDARRQLGLDLRKQYVLFAADPGNAVKRHWLAQRAVALASERWPDIELVVACGQPHDHMPLWMNAADALIITSVYEGGPLVHREAMACNLPVVSVDVGDVAGDLAPVTHSYVVDASPMALGGAVDRVLRGQSRSNGREHLRRLTSERSAEAVKGIYTSLLIGG
jgi:glycosyltransferase involved in cell wall biosynthesis